MSDINPVPGNLHLLNKINPLSTISENISNFYYLLVYFYPASANFII